MRGRGSVWLCAAVLLAAPACSPAAPPATSPDSSPRGSVVAGPSALDDPAHPAFPTPLIDLDHLFPGGVSPDGIPPIDDPQFEPVPSVDWLEDDEPVLSLTVGEETRAYPVQVMTWHEIVNDVVDGVPVAVTFCPLCSSGVAFERELDGQVLDFGTSGMLYVDNLVMYDRQTESLWPQLTGEASVGVMTGAMLEAIPMGVVGWRQFRTAHPDAVVLTRDTGEIRPYGTNPYFWRDDDPDGDLFADPPGEIDHRLPVKERIIGLTVGDRAVAVRRSRVVDSGVIHLRVGGRPVVLWHRPGQVSALDADRIDSGDEIGTVGAFSPIEDGRRLTFVVRDGRLVDEQTGTTWNVLGSATAGPLKGRRLEPVVHLDSFWFAWVGFRPDTRVIG